MSARILRVVGTVTCLVALAACSKKTADSSSTGPGPTPLPPGPVTYSAIAASDGAGVGSSVPCLPFTPCTDGMGYVPVVTRQLRADGHTVTLLNMGIPGAVLSRATQDLGNKYGLGINANFIQDEGQFVLKDSTLVTIFAGGNDANTIGTVIERGETTNENATSYIDGQIRQFAGDYAQLVSIVRARAPNARLVILNLPNLAGLPYAGGRTPTEKRWLQQLSVGFTRLGANVFASQGAIVIDLMCDARAYQSSNYSADGFHPSDAGYQYLANEVLDAVKAGSWPAPSDSCAQMTLAP
jgi:lysophospholipase L1-like esterase